MKSVNQLVTEIKQNNEDWEWYPTTSEIVDALKSHIEQIEKRDWNRDWTYNGKVLDIGCGNGCFFEKLCTDKFKHVQKFGIEKSNILAEQLPEDVIILGSDFNEQTLIDKKVDMIFCNPPYSEYDLWTEKYYGRDEKEKRMKKATHIQLDYRIVVKSWSNFDTTWSSPRLSSYCTDFLSDTFIIAKNLGFDIDFCIPNKYANIYISDWNNFDVLTTDGKLFANIKLYKNGNRHVKFCKEFMQKLNVEMARINKWVQDKTEAMEEMEVSADVINSVWGSNLQIGITDGRKLLGLPEK